MNTFIVYSNNANNPKLKKKFLKNPISDDSAINKFT